MHVLVAIGTETNNFQVKIKEPNGWMSIIVLLSSLNIVIYTYSWDKRKHVSNIRINEFFGIA